MSRFMLDTNMASYVIKGHPPEVRQSLAAVPMDSIVISVVTQAKLLYGLARKGHPAALANVIREFLLRIEVLLTPAEFRRQNEPTTSDLVWH